MKISSREDIVRVVALLVDERPWVKSVKDNWVLDGIKKYTHCFDLVERIKFILNNDNIEVGLVATSPIYPDAIYIYTDKGTLTIPYDAESLEFMITTEVFHEISGSPNA